MNNFNIHIEYVKNIRSIDLENILTGFRLLQEEALVKKTDLSKRNFTDDIIIDKVEKGSIIIELIVNNGININIVDLLLSTAAIASAVKNSNQLPKIINATGEALPKIINASGNAIAKIISAVKHGVVLTMKDNEGNEYEISENEYKNVIVKNKNNGSSSQIILGEPEKKRNKQG